MTNEEKRESSENNFETYLTDNKIPYVRFDQSQITFSKELKENEIKRPDYLVKTKHKNYFIDVKYRGVEKKVIRLIIEPQEIKQLFNFQNEFQGEVWLAFTKDIYDHNFLFISISALYDYYINIKEIFVKNNFEKQQGDMIHIPYSLLFLDQLSYNFGFYKYDGNTNLSNFDEEASNQRKLIEYHRRNK